ncbi:MAG TPA: ABC transporter substrate-binding protein [Verrucomicrobiota bacterium]|nr:ABC transporter substrate-binding protein [Verrucomicrobiota bacterium]HNU50765.1 ABC transporter substrate-binding protein [Verrucomicrobiota bacterium]
MNGNPTACGCQTSSRKSLPWRAAFLLLAASLDPQAPCAEPTVVVISPHASSIRHEFGRAFRAWHQSTFREPATVEWRDLGGTADALKFVQSEFAGKPKGIGIDCFFGGGPEPYLLLADRQLTEPYRLPQDILGAIPQSANGVELYDPQYQWYGAALSSFGILQNTRVQARCGLPQITRWEQLADPRLLGWVGAGDPRNSGTMNNMFEAFLQAYGWEQGWRVLTEIAGNVRKFDRLSSTTAKEITLGEVACGFAIDFYGFTQVAVAGRTNMTFVLPEDFTAVSPDGICILKGAPHLPIARRFLEFVLGEPGQKLWFLPRGHPEGAQQFSIERMSVRPDFYRRYREVSNIAYSPFDLPRAFNYSAHVARERREVVAALAGALLVDTHAELEAAWRALVRRGLPAPERAAYGSVPLGENEARTLAQTPWKDPALRNRTRLEWQTWAQQKYRKLTLALAP